MFMYVRARVRAPAMEVVGVWEREAGVVVVRRVEREDRRASDMRRKGRYTLASSVGWDVFEREKEGVGPFWLSVRFVDCGTGRDKASAISMSGSLAASCEVELPFVVVDWEGFVGGKRYSARWV